MDNAVQIPWYQREMDQLLLNLQKQGKVPTLLLHSCCAPCSSYVIEYLSDYFTITVFYYNPNLYPDEEYLRRSGEQKRLIRTIRTKYPVRYIDGGFEKDAFYALCKGLEEEKEGGARCVRCYRLRLEKTANAAQANGFDYFATTLTVSPLKKAHTINQIGMELAQGKTARYLCSDFKKKNGFKRSTELSAQYGLYRQDYCGCVFSQRKD